MQAIDEQTEGLLALLNAEGNPQLWELSIEDARAALKEMTLQMDVQECAVEKRQALSIPGPGGEIPIRIYWPKTEQAVSQLPMLLLYHGGGWALGDLDTHENVSRYYCAHAQAIVINVGYRLAPEHKFPAGLEDCYAALCWAAENADELNADVNRIAVTGDSAGANLSAAVCQLTNLRDGPSVVFQLLSYPSVSMEVDADYESRQAYGQGGYMLSVNDLKWLRDMYFEDAEAEKDNPLGSPILLEDLSTQPAALVITAGHDLLRDEGKHYAERLKAAGVEVDYQCFESTIHGFMSFSGALDAGKEALALAAKTLKAKFYN